MTKNDAVEAIRDMMTMFDQFNAMTIEQLHAIRPEAAQRSQTYADMVDWLIADKSS